MSKTAKIEQTDGEYEVLTDPLLHETGLSELVIDSLPGIFYLINEK